MYTIIASWYVQDGKRTRAIKALKALACEVEMKEKDTWGYLVHSGETGSLPPSSPNTIVFVEIYKNKTAFLAHVAGPVFQGFLKKNKDLFVSVPPGQDSFFQVQNLNRIEGFVRKSAS
jgi:quinol monooxygenase YgiN